ncbi:MAG: hypothetical protein J6U96_02320 [Elusimicrobiaceae bacterium]|nr:hypothetical protein [Elusimicrobiaceae bacterium]
MKVELKKIGILNVFFSAFPVAVFVVMLVSGILDIFSPDTTFNVAFVMSMVMQAILNTLLFLVFTAIFLFVYNVLCGIGIRPVTIELQDKE